MMLHSLYTILAGIALVAPATAGAADAAQKVKVNYTVSYLGLPVAQSTFTSTFKARTFTVRGELSSAGIAELFDPVRGTTSVSGRIDEGGVVPASYLLSYASGKKKQRTEIRFEGGNVASFENVPPLKKRGRRWVALGDGDLKGVMDPMSAGLVRAGSLEEVCARTLKIFDGEMRMDLKLSGGSKTAVSIDGFEGEGITCQARFIPVSGYRSGHKSLEFLKNKSKITITFASFANNGVYAPVSASVGTQIGPVKVHAVRVEAPKGTPDKS